MTSCRSINLDDHTDLINFSTLVWLLAEKDRGVEMRVWAFVPFISSILTIVWRPKNKNYNSKRVSF